MLAPKLAFGNFVVGSRVEAPNAGSRIFRISKFVTTELSVPEKTWSRFRTEIYSGKVSCLGCLGPKKVANVASFSDMPVHGHIGSKFLQVKADS